jgi:hypothetical protein
VGATPLFASVSSGAGEALSGGLGAIARSMDGLFHSDDDAKASPVGSEDAPTGAPDIGPPLDDKALRRYRNIPTEALQTGIEDWDSSSTSVGDLKQNWKQQLDFLKRTQEELEGSPSQSGEAWPKEVMLGVRFLSSKNSMGITEGSRLDGSIEKKVEGAPADERTLAEVKGALSEKMAHHLGASFAQLVKTHIPFREFDDYQRELRAYIPPTPEIQPLTHVEQLNPDNLPNLENASLTAEDRAVALAERYANFFVPLPLRYEITHPYVYMQRSGDADMFPVQRENAVVIGKGLQKGIISAQEANQLVDEERARWTDPNFSYDRDHDVVLQKLFKRTESPPWFAPSYQKKYPRIPEGVEVYSVDDGTVYGPKETMPLGNSPWIATRATPLAGYRDGVNYIKGSTADELASLINDGSLKAYTWGRSQSIRSDVPQFSNYAQVLDDVLSQVEESLGKLNLEDNEAYQAGLKWWNARASYFRDFAKRHLPSPPRNPELKGKINPELDLLTAVDRILYPLLESRRKWMRMVDERLASLTQNESIANKNKNLIRKLNDLKLDLDRDIFFITQKRFFTHLNDYAAKVLNPNPRPVWYWPFSWIGSAPRRLLGRQRN